MNSQGTKSLVAYILLICSALAQASDELLMWQAAGQIPLPEAIAADTNAEVMFADDLLLAASSGYEAGDCGQIAVFEASANGRYTRVQTLSAADFDQPCEAPDGFGFSLAFAQGNLFAGAPGDIFPAAQNLPAGAVYAYRLEQDRFTPQQRINGPGTRPNSAWGTQVETDGSRLLVQGNEPGRLITVQGFANPRSVNLLTQSGSGEWAVDQVFTDNESTLYGQDFDLNEDGLFINKHDFVGFLSIGLIFNRPSYNSALEIYSFEHTADGATAVFTGQTIINERELFDSRQALPGVNYVVAQNASFQLYRSPTPPPALFSEIRSTYYEGFILANDTWVGDSGAIAQSRTDEFRHEVGDFFDFAPENTFRLRTETVQLAIEVHATPVNRIRRQRLERFFNAERLSTAGNQQLLVNENRLVIINRNAGRINIDAFNGVPAIDPAITQAWWFGPEFDGQGVTFEVLANNRLLMHWFTYDLSGQQMWLRGSGELINDQINISLVRPSGPSFTFGEFDPDDRVAEPWGEVSISFNDCASGLLSYQSNEFGSGELPLRPIIDNGFDCGTGTVDGFFSRPLRAVGSFFDPARAGEGIILMPIPTVFDETTGTTRETTADSAIGFWLTYRPNGDQAWYYLGIYDSCSMSRRIVQDRCLLTALETPRSTTGPVFGPAYDPNARTGMPWGTAGPIEQRFVSRNGRSVRQLALPVDNPDDTGTLLLQQLTRPIGHGQL